MRQAPAHQGFIIATHEGVPFELGESARRRHLHVLGASGTGKTTLLKSMIAQDLAAGRGIAVIDPLGHLAQAVLGLIPPSRAHELVLIDPNHLERPVGLNILDAAPPDRHALIADDVLASFLHVWGEVSVGARSQQVLRNAIRALLYLPAASLLGVPRMLTDAVFRESVVRRVQDPIVLNFWQKEFASYDERRRVEVTGPILNKLDALLSAGALRNMLGQPRSTVDLRRLMDEGRILVVSLGKAQLGAGNASVLGSLLVTKLAQAAFSRQDTPQHLRRPFFLYVDEFQDYSTQSFLRILEQGRNVALATTLSHQHLAQLTPAILDSVLGNTANVITLRIGAADAPLMAAHLGLEPLVEFGGLGEHTTPPETLLTRLPNFQAYARLLVDDTPTTALPLSLYPDPPPVHPRPHVLAAHAHRTYGRDRAEVEAKINRFLRG